MVRGKSIVELNEALKKLLEDDSREQNIAAKTAMKPKIPRVNRDEQIYESSCSTMGESD